MEIEEPDTEQPPLEKESIYHRWNRVKSLFRPNVELDASVVRHCCFRDTPLESQSFQLNQTVLSPSPSQICDILSNPDYPLGYVGKRRYFRNVFLASRNRLASIVTTMFTEPELKRLEDKFWKSKKGIPWSLDLEEELQTYLKVKSQEKRKRKALLFGEKHPTSIIVNEDMRVSVSKTGVKFKESLALKHLKKEEEQLSKSEKEKILKSRRKVRLHRELRPVLDGLPTTARDSRYEQMHELRRSYQARSGLDNYTLGTKLHSQRKAHSSFEGDLLSPGRVSTSSSLSSTEETESWDDQRSSTTPDRSSPSSRPSSVTPTESKARFRGARDIGASPRGSRDSNASLRDLRDSKTSLRDLRDSKASLSESSDSKASLRSITFSDGTVRTRESRYSERDRDKVPSTPRKPPSSLKPELFGLTSSDSKLSVKESHRGSQQSKGLKSFTSETRRKSIDGGSFASELSQTKLDKKLSKSSTLSKDEDFKIKFPKLGFREKSIKFKDTEVALPRFSPRLSTKVADERSSRSETPESRDSVAEVLEIVGQIDTHAPEEDTTPSKWRVLGKKAYETFKTTNDVYAGKPPRLYTIAKKLDYLWKTSQAQGTLAPEAEGPRRYSGRWDDIHEQRHSTIQEFIRKEQLQLSREEDGRISESRSVTKERETLFATSRLSPDFSILRRGSNAALQEDTTEIEPHKMILQRKKHMPKESVHKSMTKISKRTSSYDIVEKRKRLMKSSFNTKGTMLTIMDNAKLFERTLPDKVREEIRKLSDKERDGRGRLSDEERDDKSGSEDDNLLDITAFRKEDVPVDDSEEEMYYENRHDQIGRVNEDFLVPGAHRKSLRHTRDAHYLSKEELLYSTSDKKRHKHKHGPEKVYDLDSPVDEKLDKKRHKGTHGRDEFILHGSPTEDKSVRKRKDKFDTDKTSIKDSALDTHLRKTKVDKHGTYDLLLGDSPTETKATKRFKAKHGSDKGQLLDSMVGGKLTKKIRDKSGAEKVLTRDTSMDEELTRRKKEKVTSEMVPIAKHLAHSKKDEYIDQIGVLLASTFDDTQSKPRQDEYVSLTMKLHGKQLTKEKIDKYSEDESRLLDSPSDNKQQQQLQEDEYGTETMDLRDSQFGENIMKKQTDKYSVGEIKLPDSLIYDTQRQLRKDEYRTDTTLLLDSHSGENLRKEQTYAYSADGSRMLDSPTDEQLRTRIDDTYTAGRMDVAEVDGHFVRQRKERSAVQDERAAEIGTESKLSRRKKAKSSMYEDKVTDLSAESRVSRLKRDTFISEDEGLLDASPSAILEMKKEQKLQRKQERREKKRIKASDQNLADDSVSTTLDTQEQERIEKSQRKSRDQNLVDDLVSTKLDTQEQERIETSERKSRDQNLVDDLVSTKLDTQEQEGIDKSVRKSRKKKIIEESVSTKLDTQKQEPVEKSHRKSWDQNILEDLVSTKLDTQEQEGKDKSGRKSKDTNILEESVSTKLDTQEQEHVEKSHRKSRDQNLVDDLVSTKLDTQEQERVEKSQRESSDRIILDDLRITKLDTQEQERVEKSQRESRDQNILDDLMTAKLDAQEQERVEKSQRESRDQNILEDMVKTEMDQRDSEDEEFLTPIVQTKFKRSIAETKSPSPKNSDEDERDLDEEYDDDMEIDSKLDLVRSQFEYMVSLDKSKPKVKDTRKTRKQAIMDILEQERRKNVHDVEYVDDFEDVDDDALQYETPTPQLERLKIERGTELALEESRPLSAQDKLTPVEDLGETVGSPSHRKKGKSVKSKRTEGFAERIPKTLEPESVHKKRVRKGKYGEKSPRTDKEGMSLEAIGLKRKENEVDTPDGERRDEDEKNAESTTDLLGENQEVKTGYQKDELPVAYKGSFSRRQLRSESLDSMSSSLLKLTLGSKSRSSSQFKLRIDAASKYKIDSKLFGADNSLTSWDNSLDLSSNGSSERYSDLTNPSSVSDDYVSPKARRFLPKIARTKPRPKAPPRRKPTKVFSLPDIQSDFQSRRRQIKIDHPFTGWDQDSQSVLPVTARLPKLMDSMPMLINFTAQEENKYQITFPNYDTLMIPLGSPRTECQHYVTQFGIIELFEFMLYNLVISKPDQPLDYLVDLSRGIMQQMKKHRAMSQIFTSDMDVSGGVSNQSAELLSHRASPVQSAHPLY